MVESEDWVGKVVRGIRVDRLTRSQNHNMLGQPGAMTMIGQ